MEEKFNKVHLKLIIDNTIDLPYSTIEEAINYIINKETDEPFEKLIAIASWNNKPMSYIILSQGETHKTAANIKGLITYVGKTLCTEINIVHVHPLGSISPSSSDIDYFYKSKRVLETIDVRLKDMYMVFDGEKRSIYSFLWKKRFKEMFSSAKKKYWWHF